jgi:NaMN:DMB phosphoribosyltransferase
MIGQLGAEMFYVDPGYSHSNHAGLRQYEKGHVKEGVGAGGALYLASLMGISMDQVREEVEKICAELAELLEEKD